MSLSRPIAFETASGVLLAGVGALVLSGWWVHVVTLVQWLPGTVAMVPNSALSFLLLGIALLNPNAHVSRACAAAVIALATVVLSQYVGSVDLHVDQLLATVWVSDANPYPGRMAPQSALCFIASGTAVLLPHTRFGARAGSLVQLLALLVGAVGIVSLIGYSLELELVYSWYRYTRMALHTAACFTLVGVALWLRWYTRSASVEKFAAREDHRVNVIGSALIVLVAAVGGSSGFILLAAQTEKTSRAGLTQALDNRLALVQFQLRERQNDAAAIATLALRHNAMGTQQSLRQWLQGLLSDDITAISLQQPGGGMLTVGEPVRNPELTIRLDEQSQLLWRDGATLRSEQLVYSGPGTSGPFGRLVTETRLPVLAQVIAGSSVLSATGDLRICSALSAERMRCLPTRLVMQVATNTARSRNGQPLAMSRALDGERGTRVFRNYRDHQSIGAYAPLGSTGLAFVLQQDTEDLYAPLRHGLQWLALLLGALIVVSVSVLRSQVAPLVRRTMNASAEAAASAARTTAIMNSVPDAIITIDEHGLIVAVNPAVSNMFGYAESELLGQSVRLLMPAERHAAHEQGLQRFMREGTAHLVGGGPVEVPARRRDGSTFTAQLALTEMRLGEKRFVVGNMRDVTVSKFAEAQVRRMNERLKLATQAARIGVWEWDVASNVLIWDTRMHELHALPLGTPPSYELWRSRVHPADVERVEHHIHQALLSGNELGFEFRLISNDGSERILKAAAILARDTDGKPLRVTGVNWDVTEGMRLERMKSEFVSVVSHELRTPLTSIRGALGLVVGNAAGTLPTKAQQLLEIAYRNTDRLALLVSDILDIEKIESGGMTIVPTRLDLHGLVTQALEANQAYAAARAVKLQLNAASSAAFVIGDEHRILQVLANLLSNAAKFSPVGAAVEVAIAPLASNYVRVSVRDHGPGIPEQFKARVFQKFSQADGSDSRAKGGTGLGLSISKAIIERLGGRIGYESCGDAGTTFYFELPSAHEQVAAEPLRTTA